MRVQAFVGTSVVDLFAGCGGLALGLEMAGFQSVFVSELSSDAMSTYVGNRESTVVSSVRNQLSDLIQLSQSGAELDALRRRLNREHGDVGLVVGGPPCQGFSGIGHRRSFSLAKEDIPSNFLYREMARTVAALAPRAFVFENVRGLLNAKWTVEGESGEIWRDVQSAFRQIVARVGRRRHRYVITADLVFSSDFGVPQRRPRVIMIGVREDVWNSSGLTHVTDLMPRGARSAENLELVLGDLVDPEWEPGGATTRYVQSIQSETQRYFRTLPNGSLLRKGQPLLEQQYAAHSQETLNRFQAILDNDGVIPQHLANKKFAQRVLPRQWPSDGPNLTVTSLPDDFIHFDQPRVPTVREWARLQTFPDWYKFAGPRTTGGRRRAGDPNEGIWTRDLPRFTQIGNAVPVLLGKAIGEHLLPIVD